MFILLLIGLIFLLILIIAYILLNRNSLIFILLLCLIFVIFISSLIINFGKKSINQNNEIANNFAKQLNSKYLSSGNNILSNFPSEYTNLMNLIKNTSGFTPTYNNIQILQNGENTYKSLFNELNNAQSNINIEDFILKDDEIGMQFQQILINKAKQGVKVKMIIDGLGIKVKNSALKKLRESGVEICIFNKVVSSIFTGKLNNRDHRKIFIIDGKVAFTGGLNIGNEYLGKDPKIGYWRDTDIRIEGDAVKQLQCIFLSSWYVNSMKKIEDSAYFPKSSGKYNQIVQTINGTYNMGESNIEYYYINLINNAKNNIDITTPYLVLNEKTYTAIMSAQLKGVQISIIIPSHGDSKTAYKATLYYANKLASKGINIYKYSKGFIHSKIIIIDEKIASIGTANFNNRSMKTDYDNCLLIYDLNTAKNLKQHFLEDINNSSILNTSENRNQNFMSKIYEKFCVTFSSIQ